MDRIAPQPKCCVCLEYRDHQVECNRCKNATICAECVAQLVSHGKHARVHFVKAPVESGCFLVGRGVVVAGVLVKWILQTPKRVVRLEGRNKDARGAEDADRVNKFLQ